MAGIKIEVEGIDNLARALAEADINARAVLEAAVLAGAAVIESAADVLAPSGGGMGSELRGRSKKRVKAAVGPLRQNWYWRFFETGTQPHTIQPRKARALLIGGEQFATIANPRGMAARPFLRPAVDENVDEITTEVGKPIKRALDKTHV